MPIPAKSLQELEAIRYEWSKATFTEATPVSSLRKLEREIREVEKELDRKSIDGKSDLITEYADCLMCLMDSASRAGVSVDEILIAFEIKTKLNKARTWYKNADNSYSHHK